MIDNNITLDYLFLEDFLRISNGEVLNLVNKPYTKLYISQMEEYFKTNEEYEKCAIINTYHINRFSHGLLWTLTQ
jgi:hypothetical protein